jgi:putative hydroxymethylpyrimidine transport system substrate-binding protein
MRSLAALLAAVLVATLFAGCDDDGAEPGASREATLVLDFQPNAVHTGIYSALHRGYFEDEGVEVTVREPSASTDAPKLLEARRTDFAIMDINDVAIARERGFEVEVLLPIVTRPLASVISTSQAVRRPRDLVGQTVGVTGLPSDDAVLHSVVRADGGEPEEIDRVTIGFEAVAALAAGRVEAATAFWNAEGVALRQRGLDTREFRVDDYGAPRYPELLLVTSRNELSSHPEEVEAVRAALARGYEDVVDDPGDGLEDLLDETDGLDPDNQAAQLDALVAADALPADGHIPLETLKAYGEWAVWHGIVEKPPRLVQAATFVDDVVD